MSVTLQDTGSGSTIKDIGSGRVCRDLLPSEVFTVSQIQGDYGVGSGPTETVLDVVLYQSGLGIIGGNQIAIKFGSDVVPFANLATFSSDDESIATNDFDGTIFPVAAGTCNIGVTLSGLGTRFFPVTVAAGTYHSLKNFVDGSLGAHLVAQIATRLTGLTPPNFTGEGPPYVWQSVVNFMGNVAEGQQFAERNNSTWLGAVDSTCIAFAAAGDKNGVLVTPRDMLLNAHSFGGDAESMVGYQPVFIDNDGNTVSRTVAAGAIVDGTDIAVGTLDSDLPLSITSVTMLPADFRDFLPQPQYLYPCVVTNQDHVLLITGVFSTVDVSGEGTWSDSYAVSNNYGGGGGGVSPEFAAFYYKTPRGNDSGSPFFMLIDGSLILLSTWHGYGNGGIGPILADSIDAINAAISANAASLVDSATPYSTPYTVSTFDLGGAGFTNYG